MGHLDKLNDEMKDKGLSVIAITKQDRSAVDAFVEETGATHPIVCEKTDSMRNYGRTSYPSAFLIDPGGRILWVGHPGNLQDSVVVEHLEKAKILPEFPKALKSARKSFLKDKYSDVYKKVVKALDGTSLSDEDRETTGKIKEWIDWYASSNVEGAGKATESGNVYAAWATYEHIARAYKGLDISKRAAALAKELLADKANKKEIDGGKKLAKIKAELGDLSPKKAIKALEALTGKKYSETRAGKQAAELIKRFEQMQNALR